MEEKVLSADELLKSQQDLAQGVPSFGNKLVEPSGNLQEWQDLEHRMNDLKSTLNEPRISLRSQLSEAIWDPTKDLARVVKPFNKHWGVMGHIVDNCLHIYPEEALFLLESNAIEVKLNDIAMSIQQSYEVMLAKDCSLDEYRVYSHLTRQGYKVVRHQGRDKYFPLFPYICLGIVFLIFQIIGKFFAHFHEYKKKCNKTQ